MLTKEQQSLVLKHIAFAEKIAKCQAKKTPPQVQYDELKSAAYMGLVDAATRYDGKSDFESFARFRIIGEVKDYLRSLKWDRNTNTVASIPEGYDVVAEPEPESFDDVLDEFAKNRISPLAKTILRDYYGERLSISQIATKANLSDARISQLINQNVETIRFALSA
jgi:RNA polymerase sigma factor (sigma-70 family)